MKRRIYACCAEQQCVTCQNTLRYLREQGIEPVIADDYDGHFLEFAYPTGWSTAKMQKLNDDLDERQPVIDEWDVNEDQPDLKEQMDPGGNAAHRIRCWLSERGFAEHEIDQVDAYIWDQIKSGKHNNAAALVCFDYDGAKQDTNRVSQRFAEILDKSRPGMWLR